MIESTFAFFGAIIVLIIFYGVLSKVRLFSIVGFALLLILGLFVLSDGIQISSGTTRQLNESQNYGGSITFNTTYNITNNITNNITEENNVTYNNTMSLQSLDDWISVSSNDTGHNVSFNESKLNNTINATRIFIASTNCSGTNKVSAINNSTGVVTCSADQTGGSSLAFNYTASDTTITSNATYVTLLTLPVTAGTPAFIECFLHAKSNLTTSGIQIQLNLSDVTGMNQTSSIEYMTTVTAKARCVSDSAIIANTCAATTSVVSIVPTMIRWYSNQTNSGLFQLKFKPETNNIKAIIAMGAYCRQVY
jgi:hypothetical protein